MKKIFISIVSIFLLIGCTSKYPDFDKANNGIYYKLLEIGDDTLKIKSGDFITAEISYKTINDSVFFKGKRKFQLANAQYQGSIEECFQMLSKEDRATFIISADSFFTKTLQSSLPNFIPLGSNIKIEIKILEVELADDYLREKEAFLKWIEDFGAYEKELMKQFIEQKRMNAKPTTSGLYFIQLKVGNGKKVEKGKIVEIDYEGKFLDGRFFDSTKRRKESQSFVYGTEMQVIPGLEEAIGRMTEGEKALVVIPSELAWGSDGSSTGIIPPYTATVFEIELKAIRDK